MAQQNELIGKSEQLNKLSSAKNEQVQTGIDFLFSELNHCIEASGFIELPPTLLERLTKQAKKIEEQRIIEFGDEYADAVMGGCIKRAKQFYEEDYAK